MFLIAAGTKTYGISELGALFQVFQDSAVVSFHHEHPTIATDL
jgi:hypothetical protein